LPEVLEHRLIGGVGANVQQEVNFQLALVGELLEKKAQKFLLLQLNGLDF